LTSRIKLILGTNADEYAESRMSRFAIDITIYLAIALAQWVVTVIIVEKIADPFRNFMDLCSVANISVLAFTHPLRAVSYKIMGLKIPVYSITFTDAQFTEWLIRTCLK
jgi:hypothetical protein